MSGTSPNPATGRDAAVEQRRREAPEAMSYPEVRGGINTLDRTADSVHDRLRDVADVDDMMELRSDLPPSEQLTGITLLQSRLINVLTRMFKARPDLNPEWLKPGELMRDAALYRVELSSNEIMAWQKYMELVSQPGPTAQYLVNVWRGKKGEEGMVQQARTASKGFVGQIGEFAQQHPGQALVYAAATVAGVYLGYKLIKGIWGWFTKDEKEEGAKESFWRRLVPSKATAVALGVIAAAAGLSMTARKGLLRQLLMAMTPDEIKELMAKGEALPEKVRKEIEETRAEVERLRAQVEAAKGKAGEVAEAAKAKAGEVIAEAAVPANQFQGAKEIFLRLYFYNEREFEVGKKQAVIDAINDLKDTPLGVLKEVTEKNTEAKVRPRLKANAAISKEHLWYLVSRIQEVRKHFPDATDAETVQDLFIRIFNDPIQKINEHFHSAILEKIRTGKFADIANIDFRELDRKILDNAGQTLDAINANLKIDTTGWNSEDKTTLRSIQWHLFSESGLSQPPEEAVEEAMKLRGLRDVNPTVLQTAQRFYTAIRDKMPGLIRRCQERFEIKTLEGAAVPESELFIQNGFKMENVNFRNGVLLVLATEGMKWDEKQKENVHWMKDLALLNLIFRCMPAAERNRYIGRLAKLVANAEIDVHLPQLAALKPYFEALKGYVVDKSVNHGLGILERSIDFRNHPPHEAANLKERLKEHPVMTFVSEAGSGGLEIATDGLALIISTLGITPEDFSGVQSAEDLFHLILSKKDGSLMYAIDKETGKISMTNVLIHVGTKYIWAKPIGIIKDSFSWENIKNADLGDMAQRYLVLDAPFVVLGALNGSIKSAPNLLGRLANVFKGAGQGLLYPIKAPLWGARAVGHTVDAAASGAIAAKEYAVRPLQWTNDFKFWIGDKARYGILSEPQNVTNLTRDIQLFDHYYRGAADELQPMEFRKKVLQWFEDPKNAVRRLGSSFNKRMAFRYAERFRLRYGRFFDFTGQGLANPVWVKEINETNIGHLREAANRLERGLLALIDDPEYQKLKGLAQKGGIHWDAEFSDNLRRLFERAGFSRDANEVESLARQIKDEKALRDFIDRMERGTAEIKKTSSKPSKIAEGTKRAAARSREWLHDRKWYQDFEKWRGAKFTVKDLERLGQITDNTILVEELKARKIPADLAEKIAPEIRRAGSIDEIQTILKTAAEEAKLTVKFAPEVGRILRIVRPIARAIPYAGAAVYGWQAYHAFAESARTSNRERKHILWGKGGLYTAGTGAELALIAPTSAAIAAGTVAGVVAGTVAAAAPLAPVYMGESALESKYEATLTAQDWAARTEPRQLIHDWISTHAWGAGEAYRLGASQEEIAREKQATNQKIAEALILQQQGDPRQPANPDRLHYLGMTCNFKPPANYHEALDYLRDSRIYADLMQSRRDALAQHESIMVGNVELTNARFENPDRAAIAELLQANKTEELANLQPALKQNFDHFSDRYLVDLCCEALTLQYREGSDATEAEKEFARQLESYLTYARGIDVSSVYAEWMALKVEKGKFDGDGRKAIAEQAREAVAQLQSDPSRSLREDIENHTGNRAVYAVTELARFFGYTGYPNEEALKGFFDEAHKGAYGVYWDGDEWSLNEEGLEVDEDLGDTLDENTVRRAIKLMREDPDNVIETRQDALVDIVSLHQFDNQVLQMAGILEQGLKIDPTKKLKPLKPAPVAPREPVAEAEIETPVVKAA